MTNETAQTIGTILGSFAAAFAAQMWGNFVTKRAAQKVVDGTAAQTTVNEIKGKVEEIAPKVDTLVKQPGVVQTQDDRSPERKE